MERALGTAVLLNALEDATRQPRAVVTSAYPTEDEIHEARRFLLGGPMLDHWCQSAGVDTRSVIERAQHLQSHEWSIATLYI